ncbi:hypothetical protein [Burkholderia ubonensis]|uniref:hypothetical protein n=1 Tax=Burkholderia ubonensis TaxID=101571 RepID=UPI00075B9DE6|nr:hypothetical protein [Burkholderia ubonensis]KVP17237.1 hypothetical protein WJ84_03045 [Burkholderia ubonensis]KVP39640.1 hypothetical protein WJ87_05315 [Burkholderia ubonensis]
MNKLALYAVLCVSLGLVACGNNGTVTDRHIAMATEKCAVNGGLAVVEQAERSRMYESCGYRCSRVTGQFKYSATFSCKNGAKFDLSWEE